MKKGVFTLCNFKYDVVIETFYYYELNSDPIFSSDYDCFCRKLVLRKINIYKLLQCSIFDGIDL